MIKVTSSLLTLAMLGSLMAPCVLGDCKCRLPEERESTHWGGNEEIVMKEETSYRKLEGIVEYLGDRPLANALVEIFDQPDYLLDESVLSKRDHVGQKRLAACRTAANGTFCFRNLPSGKYELRSSFDSEWNVTQVYVVVDKKSGKNQPLRVSMRVGT